MNNHKNYANGILKYRYFIAFTIYFICSVSFLGYPNKFNFISSMPIGGDQAWFLWCIKWWPYALKHYHNPFVTDKLWAPFGQNLAWTTSIPSLAIILWPVTSILGPIFSYNLANILGLTLNAFAVFLICRSLSIHYWPSIFGGFIFFFSSYQWGQLVGHLNLTVTFAILFLIYLFILRLNDRIGRIKYIIFCSILLAFQFGVSNEIYTTAIIFAFMAYIIAGINAKMNISLRHKLTILGIETTVGIIISTIVLTPYLYFLFKDNISQSIQNTSFFSTDPINFLIPTPITWLGGNLLSGISNKFAGNFSEEGAYLGLPLLIIVITFIYQFRDDWYRCLIIILAILFLFSLGPYLRILNHKSIVLPWFLFTQLPLIKHVLPIRFTFYIFIIISIIAALWMEKYKVSKHVKLMMAFISILFLFPNVNIYKGNVTIPTFFKNNLYKKYIKYNENIIMMPPFGSNGIGMAYQEKTNFYFNVSQGYAGVIPKRLLSDSMLLNIPQLLIGGGVSQLPKNYASAFDYYILKCDVNKIITVGKLDDNSNKILHTLIITPQKIEGVLLYSFTRRQIENELIKNNKKEFNNMIASIESLKKAITNYIVKYKTYNNIYPLYLEKIGLLDNSFGGFPINALNNNWTADGYWIGKWGDSYAIGYSPITGETVDLLYKKYSKEIEKIYFPYPQIFTEGNNVNKFITGQVLLQFKINQSRTRHVN